jgi:type VI secretion system protein VasD
MERRRIAIGFVAILMLLIPLGCGAKKTVSKITLQSMTHLNPDDRGSSLPVVVRVYQLKNSEQIKYADALTLWQNDFKVLGDALLDRQETTVYPDTDYEVVVTKKEEAQYLAVAAFFRKSAGNSWRQIIPLDKKRKKIYIILEGQTVGLSKKKRKR